MDLAKNSSVHKVLSPAFLASGYYHKLWQERAAKEPLTAVICYHRVVAEEPAKICFGTDGGVSAATFEAQVKFMLRYFTPIRPSEVKAEGGSGLSFAVTFDDGFGDNFTVAAPILKRLGVSATFFVASDYVGTERFFWWEQFGAMVREARVPALNTSSLGIDPVALKGVPKVLTLGDMPQKLAAYKFLVQVFMRSAQPDIYRYLANISEALQVKIRPEGRGCPLMTWDQLRKLRSQGFEIGAHTATHYNLGHQENTDFEHEIFGAIKAISSQMDIAVTSFAYPYGAPEHQSDAAAKAIAKAGCTQLFTTEARMMTPADSALALPRFYLNKAYNFASAYNLHNAFMATR